MREIPSAQPTGSWLAPCWAMVLVLVAALATLGRGTVEAQRKATVTGITITNTGGTGPVVKWQAVQGATSYLVERITSATSTGTRSPQLAATTWTDTALPAAGTYTYRVTATLRKGTVTGEASFTWAPASATGTSAGASALTLTPSFCDFGTVAVGSTSEPCALTLINSGAQTGTLAMSAPGAPNFSFTSTCTGQVLPAGTSCVISVRFAPTQAGSQATAFQVRDMASSQGPAAQIMGIGAAASSVLSLTPAGCDFGTVTVGTTSGPCALTLVNSGAQSGQLAITVSGASASAFSFTSTCTGLVVAAGSSCVISLRFAPTQTGGQGVVLQVRDMASTSAGPAAQIGGTGGAAAPTGPAVLTLSPNGCDFGTVSVGTTSSPCSLTLTNSGGPDGVLISTASGNPSFPSWVNAFPFTATGCGQMQAGASCVITFRFAPTQTGGQGVVLQVRNAAGTVQVMAQIGGTGS